MRIEAKELNRAWKLLEKAISGRTFLPVIKNVLYKDGQFTATNLEVWVRVQVQAEAEEGEGFLIPNEVFKTKHTGMVMMTHTAGMLTIRDESYKEAITGQFATVEDFPPFPAGEEKLLCERIDMGGFKKAGSMVLHAVAESIGCRPVLEGVLLDLSKGQLVSCDGYRVAMADCQMKGEGNYILPIGLFKCLPTKGLANLIAMGKEKVSFRGEGWDVTASLIEGTYPNYRQLIPEEFKSQMSFNPVAMREAVEKLRDKGKGTEIVLRIIEEGKLSLSRKDEEQYWEATIPIKLVGEKIAWVGLNADYLTDALKQKPDTFSYNSPSSPVMFTGQGYKEVVMPIDMGVEQPPPVAASKPERWKA